MTEQEIEYAIVGYLTKELDNRHATIEAGTVNAPAIYELTAEAGAIIVAYNGDPSYLNIPPLPDNENFSQRPKSYHRIMSFVISIGYHNLEGPGANLYDLLGQVREKMINLAIPG
ncbi:hypothetical protein EG827_12215, partial [bacterium]|nr:hypothetical protein [bacterium]